MDDSLDVKGAAMLASPSFTMGMLSSSRSRSTWLRRSCGVAAGGEIWLKGGAGAPLPRLTLWEMSCSSGGGSPDLCLAALEWALPPLLLRIGLSRGRRLRSTTRSGALARSATPGGGICQDPGDPLAAGQIGVPAQHQGSATGRSQTSPRSTQRAPLTFYKLLKNKNL